MNRMFADHTGDPMIIAALHLPDLSTASDTSMAFLEDYVLANTEVFVTAGISRIMLQDQTRRRGAATPQTVAMRVGFVGSDSIFSRNRRTWTVTVD